MQKVFLSQVIHQMEELASDMRAYGFISEADRVVWAERLTEVIDLVASAPLDDKTVWKKAHSLVLEMRGDYLNDIANVLDRTA